MATKKKTSENAEVRKIAEGVTLSAEAEAIIKSIDAVQVKASEVFGTEDTADTERDQARKTHKEFSDGLGRLLEDTFGIAVKIQGLSKPQRDGVVQSITYTDENREEKSLAVEDADKDASVAGDDKDARWVNALIRGVFAIRTYDGKKTSRQNIFNYKRAIRLGLHLKIQPAGFLEWLDGEHVRDDGARGKGLQAAANRATDVLATADDKKKRAEAKTAKLDKNIGSVTDGGIPWKEPPATVERNGIVKHGVIPVAVMDGKLFFGFQHAELDEKAFNSFMARAEKRATASAKAVDEGQAKAA